MIGSSSLFSGFTREEEESEYRPLIKSKPLIWCLIGSVFVFAVYFFGWLDAILIMLALTFVLTRWPRPDVDKPEGLSSE
jgi:hypothetical protein